MVQDTIEGGNEDYKGKKEDCFQRFNVDFDGGGENWADQVCDKDDH